MKRIFFLMRSSVRFLSFSLSGRVPLCQKERKEYFVVLSAKEVSPSPSLLPLTFL